MAYRKAGSVRRAGGSSYRGRTSYNVVNGIVAGNSWYNLQKAVAKRSGGRCETITRYGRCANKAHEVHHIVPLPRGSNTMANVIHLCKACHDLKHNHLFRLSKDRR